MDIEEPLVIILGPTAVGKTLLSVQLARKLGASIISADAFQVYRFMDIGTAKTSLDVRNEIPHYLIDIMNPDENYDVTLFKRYAEDLIDSLSPPVIICGGAALYLKAFLYQFSFPDIPESESFRLNCLDQLDQSGAYSLWQQLAAIDPDIADKVPYQNVRRVIRYLEIYHFSKKKPSEIKKFKGLRKGVHIIGLSMNRTKLIESINERVDRMILEGWVEEVEFLLKKYPSKSMRAYKALGYQEIMDYLEGKISKEMCSIRIKIKTRQFAKRQMTWFRSMNEAVEWINLS